MVSHVYLLSISLFFQESFLADAKELIHSMKAALKSFTKSFKKTVMMEYFHSNLEYFIVIWSTFIVSFSYTVNIKLTTQKLCWSNYRKAASVVKFFRFFMFWKHALIRKEWKVPLKTVDALLLGQKSMTNVFEHFLKPLLTNGYRGNNEVSTFH